MPASRKPFRLTRYFSVVSLGLMALVGVATSYYAQALARSELTEMAERRNEAMTAVFLNVLWPDFEGLVAATAPADADGLRAFAAAGGLHRKSAGLMHRSEIVKVKLYNPKGLTVYSSDPRQIGEDKYSNPGFASAMAGKPQSGLTHRNSFDAFEGQRVEIDLIGSYLPIHAGGRIVGVIELYQDVTPFVQRLDRLLLELLGVGMAIMLGLYGLQLLLVQRAQGILQRQEDELQTANEELDLRVQQRTAELTQAKYCPSIQLADLGPYPAGIRAQAVLQDGTLVDDFLFQESPRSLHVCNAPSPAATSAIPIGNFICEKIAGSQHTGTD